MGLLNSRQIFFNHLSYQGSLYMLYTYQMYFDNDDAANNKNESENHSVVSDSLQPHGLYSPWNSPDQKTGLGSLSLLQGIFPTQELNPGLLHWRCILY